MRHAHRLQPAARRPVELRGRPREPEVQGRRIVRLRQPGRGAPHLQPAQGRARAGRRQADGDTAHAAVLTVRRNEDKSIQGTPRGASVSAAAPLFVGVGGGSAESAGASPLPGGTRCPMPPRTDFPPRQKRSPRHPPHLTARA
nr:MAG TPA: hypothetical protein [Caudoviricetes sp.]